MPFSTKQEDVFVCDECQPPEENHLQVKGRLDCPHQHEVGPYPTGIPRKVPCPGAPTGQLYNVTHVKCTEHGEGQWHPAP